MELQCDVILLVGGQGLTQLNGRQFRKNSPNRKFANVKLDHSLVVIGFLLITATLKPHCGNVRIRHSNGK